MLRSIGRGYNVSAANNLEADLMADPFNIADLTPEQQQIFRLEAIFMPEARRQRDRHYRENPGPKFVHYTTAEAALSIIEQKRMWLRNTRSMADYREVRHGFELLQRLFHENEFALQKSFVGACDTCKPGAAEQALGLFDKWWTHTAQGIQTRTYIASISEHDPSEDQHGRLLYVASVWRERVGPRCFCLPGSPFEWSNRLSKMRLQSRCLLG